MKEYLDKIVNNGKPEDMDCLGEMLITMIDDLKDTNYDKYKKYKNKIIGMAYDYTINDELAKSIVDDMKPRGEYWSKETVTNVVGNVPNIDTIYVVMNSLVNDYGDIISPDEVETYVKMTMAWIDDEDGHENKAWWYFVK